MKKRMLFAAVTLLLFLGTLACHHAALGNFSQENWVEILCPGDREAAQAVLAQYTEAQWETDRFVVQNADLFTAQILEAKLIQAGVGSQSLTVLDYSWACDVLEQSTRLWMAAAAIAMIGWMAWLIWRQAREETERLKAALSRQYLGPYLYDAGVRLLTKAIAGMGMTLAAILLLRRLTAAPVYLPPTLLPMDSLFDLAHYRCWSTTTFPEGCLSEYGAALLHLMKLGYYLGCLECVLVILLGLQAKKT